MTTALTMIDQAAPSVPLSGNLSARVIDQFFRRWPLYVIPFALLVAVGVVTALGTEPDYRTFASLSASSNPLVDETPVRGNTISVFETPANGTARLINERLATDSFIDDVAARAGLSSAIDSGLIGRDVVREQVGASVVGDNVLEVAAEWSDPETSFLLVDSTVSAYLDYVLEVVSADSSEAIELLTDVRASTEVRVASAEQEFEAYLAANPPPSSPDVEIPFDEQLVIQRLNDALSSANTALQEVDGQITGAELSAQRASSDAGRQIRIIDDPQIPTSPEPIRMGQLVTMLMFTLLGIVVSGAALFAVTALDRSVRLPGQLEEVARTDVIAVVPMMKANEMRPAS